MRPAGLESVATPSVTDDLLHAAHVLLTVEGPVATVTLDRPDQRNAQTPQTWAALARVPELLGAEVRIVVVRGSGRSFSAGLDRAAWTDGTLRAVAELPDAAADAAIAGFQRGFGWLADPARITIAAVQGHAIGAGFQLALGCQLIIAADDAEFSLYEVVLGLVPDLGGVRRLVRAVGERRALELGVTGRRMTADQALGYGLLHSVVPVGELVDATAVLVASILANPARAVSAVGRLVAAATSTTVDEQNALDRSAQIPLLRSLLTHAEPTPGGATTV